MVARDFNESRYDNESVGRCLERMSVRDMMTDTPNSVITSDHGEPRASLLIASMVDTDKASTTDRFDLCQPTTCGGLFSFLGDLSRIATLVRPCSFPESRPK